MITLTEGHASNANPIAEGAIATVSRVARSCLEQALQCLEATDTREACAAYLWHFAMQYSAAYVTATYLSDSDAPGRLGLSDFAPFCARVLYRKGHKVKTKPGASSARTGYYLGPSFEVPHGSLILNSTTGETEVSTTVRAYQQQGEWFFPRTLHLPAETGPNELAGFVWIQ